MIIIVYNSIIIVMHMNGNINNAYYKDYYDVYLN